MTQRCQICSHQEKSAIDKALVSGKKQRDLARAYGVSEKSLSRHKKNHLSKRIVQHYAKIDFMDSQSLYNSMIQMTEKLNGILARAEHANEKWVEIACLKELRSTAAFVLNTASLIQDEQRRRDADAQKITYEKLDRLNEEELLTLERIITKLNENA